MAFINGNKPIITNGLVYALDFGNSRCYIPTTSIAKSLAYDPLGSTVIEGTTNIDYLYFSTSLPLYSNGTLNFTGPQYIRRTGSFSALSNNNEFTIQVVAKAITPGSLFSINSPVGNLSAFISPTSSNFGFVIGTETLSRTYTGFTSSSLQHITYRYSYGTMDVFINGIPVTASRTEVTLQEPAAVNAFTINKVQNEANYQSAYSGSIAQVFVYNKSLSADEIYTNYLASAIRNNLSETLKPYSIDENTYKYVLSTGITDTNTINAVNTFVTQLKSNRLWDKLTNIYPIVTNNTSSQIINLKDPGVLPLILSGNFTGSNNGIVPLNSTSTISTALTKQSVYPTINSQSFHISYLSYDSPQTSSYIAGYSLPAIGGNVIGISGSKVYHAFKTVGTSSFTMLDSGVTNVEVLVVAGGGGAGKGDGNNYGAGGGGAGGLILSSSYTITPGVSYEVVVGAGGAGRPVFGSGSNGQNSYFASIVATGGGGGGAGGGNPPSTLSTGSNGGSGGGGGGILSGNANPQSGSGIPGQGFDGGNGGLGGGGAGGGGGGAGGKGQNGTGGNRANGGSGIVLSITGESVEYAFGGWGEGNTTDSLNPAQPIGTGNGGNGTRFGIAGSGGSGIVIVSYTPSALKESNPSTTIKLTQDAVSGSVNNSPAGGISGGGTIGFLTVSRTGSNSYTLTKNASSVSIASPVSQSANIPILLNGIYNGGIPTTVIPYQVSYASQGAGLTNSEVSTYYNLVSQLQTNLKRQNTLLDTYTGAELAHSLRRVGPSGYFGPAIRVQRSSDNTLRDIGFTSDGQLDTVGLLDFVGTGSGIVNTWYDQSGNGRNFAAAGTPLIVISGSIVTVKNKPSVYLNGSSGFSTFGAPYLANTPITIFNYQQLWLNDNAQRYYFITTLGTSGALIIGFAPSDNWLLASWGYQDGGIIGNTQTLNPNLLTGIYTSPGSLFYKDGQLVGTNTTTPPVNMFTNSQPYAELRLGGWWGGYDYPGIVSENIIYAKDLTTTRASVDSNILSYYATGSDTDYQSFITATGITQPTQSQALETLVSDLKSYGLWNKMKAIYPMITDKYNLYSNTENLSTGWLTTNSTLTASNAAGPFTASLVANRLNEISGSGISPTIYQTVALTSGSSYVMSVYARWNNRDYLVLNPDGNSKTWFDIKNGFVSSSQGTVATASITRVSGTASNPSGSWYRCAMVFTSSVSTPYNTSIQVANTDGSLTYDSLTATSGSFLWGAQFEPGDFISPYLSNNTGTAFTTGSILDQMKYNLKDPRNTDSAFRLTYSGSWTPGYSGNKPDGVTAWASTKLTPSTNLPLNSTHFSLYLRNTTTGLDYQGSEAGGRFMINYYPNQIYSDHYGSTTGRLVTSVASSKGFILTSRTSTTSHRVYQNQNLINSTTALSDNAAPTSHMYIGGANLNGNSNPPLYFANAPLGFTTLGDGLTDYEAKALYWIIQKYQTTLGRQVY